MSTSQAPTTHVSADGMTISYKEHTLSVSAWYNALDSLCAEIEEELNALCGLADALPFHIPDNVPDDWTTMTHGYTWLKNGTFVKQE
jgi:hypothetical protein